LFAFESLNKQVALDPVIIAFSIASEKRTSVLEASRFTNTFSKSSEISLDLCKLSFFW